MKSFSASGNIKAAPDTIWKILTDAPNYPKWDPWADRIEGTIAAGQKIKAFTKLAPNRAFPVTIMDFAPGKGMKWVGGMPLGLFKGVRTFTLTPKSDGSVDFSVKEEFTGPLLPMFAGSLPDMTEPFRDFVAGLKARAEAQSR
ncbi:MAG: SRPBCC domain-containing protein [Anaerolineae bacterium]|nr:SRPBCC domain-containing protein [Anaerolineae bacterium]